MVGSSFNPRPKSINEVVDYALKRLGVQLLEINVTEEQILDRISDAVSYFQEHHADGTFEGYFKTKITPTTITISPSIVSASVSPSASPSASTSFSPSVSVSPSSSSSASRSASVSPSASGSPSSSFSISPSSSFSPSSSRSPSSSSSASFSSSPSSSLSPSASVSPSSSVSPSVSPSSSGSPSSSLSPSASVSTSISPSASKSPSASLSPSASVSPSASPSTPYVIKAGDVISSSTWSAAVYSINDAQTIVEIKNFQPTAPDSSIQVGQIICIEDDEYVVDSVTLGTPELGYVTIPNNVESILSVAQLPSYSNFNQSPGIYDPFKTWTNQLFHYKGSGLAVSFYLQQVRNDTLSQINTLQPWADFNRYMNRAYINGFDYNANIGQWLVLRVIVAVDPEEYPEMYGDTWFLRYCVELIRRQWGENLEKFDEVALLNGVKVNGTKMRDLADERIKALEQEMWDTYRVPDDFFLA